MALFPLFLFLPVLLVVEPAVSPQPCSASVGTKPASALTPSDLPSLPSSKKVHKWLADTSRSPGSTASGGGPPAGWSPDIKSPAAAKDTYPPPAGTSWPAAAAQPAAASQLDEAELARSLIQVLGDVASQTLAQSNMSKLIEEVGSGSHLRPPVATPGTKGPGK